MGAAILVQSVDEFDAVVAEGSFATFRQVAQYRVAEKTGVWPRDTAKMWICVSQLWWRCWYPIKSYQRILVTTP